MAVNPVNNNSYTYEYAKTQKAKADQSEQEQQAATQTNGKEKVDTFEKSSQYKPDMDKVNAMKSDLAKNVSAFKQMVQGIFQKQGNLSNTAMNVLMEIDKATQLEAQAAIAEDGYWGVEQTASRILDFAKAISGGDPSKIDLLRSAVEKGFDAVEKLWGGKLPEISYQTKDRVMEGFQKWADEANGTPEDAAEAVKEDK